MEQGSRFPRGTVTADGDINSGPSSTLRIDEKYLNDSTPQKAYRLETYRSSGNPSKGLAHRELGESDSIVGADAAPW